MAGEGQVASRIEADCQVEAAHVWLGIEHPMSGSFASEVARRLRAANRAWKELDGVWFRRAVGYRVKRNLFLSAVMGAALAGLTAVMPSGGDLARLRRCLEKELRGMMMGGATQWEEREEGVEARSLPSLSVWRYWRMSPPEVELRVQRLRWYQS